MIPVEVEGMKRKQATVRSVSGLSVSGLSVLGLGALVLALGCGGAPAPAPVVPGQAAAPVDVAEDALVTEREVDLVALRFLPPRPVILVRARPKAALDNPYVRILEELIYATDGFGGGGREALVRSLFGTTDLLTFAYQGGRGDDERVAAVLQGEFSSALVAELARKLVPAAMPPREVVIASYPGWAAAGLVYVSVDANTLVITAEETAEELLSQATVSPRYGEGIVRETLSRDAEFQILGTGREIEREGDRAEVQSSHILRGYSIKS